MVSCPKLQNVTNYIGDLGLSSKTQHITRVTGKLFLKLHIYATDSNIGAPAAEASRIEMDWHAVAGSRYRFTVALARHRLGLLPFDSSETVALSSRFSKANVGEAAQCRCGVRGAEVYAPLPCSWEPSLV